MASSPSENESRREQAPAQRPKRKRNLPVLFLLSSVALFFGSCAGSASREGWFYGFSVAALVALFGAFSGAVRIARILRESPGATVKGPVLALVANLAMTALGALAASLSVAEFVRGRQLRRFGRVLLPPVRRGSSWAHAGTDRVSVPEELCGAVAAQWRENGRTEHASVAAFARVTLDLMSLGAPPGLIASMQRDALDEIRHTELCFSLARAIDGQALEPGPFPAARQREIASLPRPLALARLAVDSLIDGALHEGVSARIIAKLAKRCEDPAIRAILKEIAQDEGRHAAHGWDVVEWCVAEGGSPVLHALLGGIDVLPERMESPLPFGATEGAWERWGIHGHALEQGEYRDAREALVRRVHRTARAHREEPKSLAA